MAYEGARMIACPVEAYDFTQTYAVVVSGDGPNFCGHLILKVGLQGAERYLHVAGVYTEPLSMDESGYRRYLEETGKSELKRFRVTITDANAAMREIEILLSKKWLWGILPHNCARFVEDVVAAGGSKAGLYMNCPALEHFD